MWNEGFGVALCSCQLKFIWQWQGDQDNEQQMPLVTGFKLKKQSLADYSRYCVSRTSKDKEEIRRVAPNGRTGPGSFLRTGMSCFTGWCENVLLCVWHCCSQRQQAHWVLCARSHSQCFGLICFIPCPALKHELFNLSLQHLQMKNLFVLAF